MKKKVKYTAKYKKCNPNKMGYTQLSIQKNNMEAQNFTTCTQNKKLYT